MLNARHNRITHLRRADFLRSRLDGIEDVAGAVARVDGFGYRRFNRRCRVVQTEAVAEHQRARKNLRNRVREIFARDVRRGAAGGFVEAEGVSARGRAKARAGQHAE